MATKKAGSTAKKTTRSKSQPAKTTVTTVKAVETTKAASSSRFSKLTDNPTRLIAALIGEFIGTFLLASAFLVTKGEPLYMGFVLVGLVLIVGTLSGAYLNPMLTIGAWVTRKLSHLRALTFVITQLLGAGAAYLVLQAFVAAGADTASAYAQAPELFKFIALNDTNAWYIFFAELLGTTVFAFAVAGALREKTDRVAKSITMGFGLFIGLLVASLAASYASAYVALNPAIALAASAIDWSNINWTAVVAYIGAPLLGGIVGFYLRDIVETE